MLVSSAYSSLLKIEAVNTPKLPADYVGSHLGRQRSWLRHYATSRKVTGLIPDKVIGFFN
jgi:hypothetical protein